MHAQLPRMPLTQRAGMQRLRTCRQVPSACHRLEVLSSEPEATKPSGVAAAQ